MSAATLATAVALLIAALVPATAAAWRLGSQDPSAKAQAAPVPNRTAVAAVSPPVASSSVPTEETPPQRIACGPLDVRYEPAGAPDNLDADIHAVFQTVAAAAGRPVTFSGPVSGVPLTIHWSADIAPAAGQTELTSGPMIERATITLNPDLSLPAGDVAGGWRVVLLHEGGHAMGLAHQAGPAGGVMVPAFDDTVTPRYTPGQAAAIRWAASSPDCQ